MDGKGALVFDVNDFDEAYLGPFTWDLRRFVASLALMCWQKALPDDGHRRPLRAGTCGRTSTRSTTSSRATGTTSGRCGWTPPTGAVQEGAAAGPAVDAHRPARPDDGRRGLRAPVPPRAVDPRARPARAPPGREGLRVLPEDDPRVEAAWAASATPSRTSSATSGFGIGSAGLPAYNLLVEGHTQALENDIVLSMKQGNVAAPSRVVGDQEARVVLQAPRAPDRGLAVRAAGARRPVARVDRDGRHRLRRRGGLALRRRPGLVRDLRARRPRAGRRAARPGDRQGALRERQGLRRHASRRLPDRGRGRRAR